MAEKPWPDRLPTAAEEAEARRKRIDDEPPMGAMGPHDKVQVFRRYQKPPPLVVVVALPSDEVGDISDLDDYDYQLDR